jgi:hypothetical protein
MRLLRPKDRIVFTFPDDADLPVSERPKLIGKVLSVADARQMASMKDATGGSSIDRIIEAAMVGLSGWENVNHPVTGEPIPFSSEALATWLTIDELLEVIAFLTGRLTVDERKKSESPQSSDVANCVPVAPVVAGA